MNREREGGTERKREKDDKKKKKSREREREGRKRRKPLRQHSQRLLGLSSSYPPCLNKFPGTSSPRESSFTGTVPFLLEDIGLST
jgi:hypothetical protein